MAKKAQHTQFSAIGGHAALDFANTLSYRLSPAPEERLHNFDGFMDFCVQAGHCSAREFSSVVKSISVSQAAAAYQSALTIRELLYRAFAALLSGQAPRESDLESLNEWSARSTGKGAIGWQEGRFAVKPEPTSRISAEMLRQRIMRSALEFLLSGDAMRIAQCEDDRGCGWLFVDKSRAQRRRWCSMQDCGNRAKVQRHRMKTREYPT